MVVIRFTDFFFDLWNFFWFRTFCVYDSLFDAWLLEADKWDKFGCESLTQPSSNSNVNFGEPIYSVISW